jgi:nitrogenase molybdenum-iron protein beta chain
MNAVSTTGQPVLKHTSAGEKPREALVVNPAKTCQPVGAMYAALGIHGCLPHSHGSQGCCAYHRSALTRHYKEPVMAATSSFTEGSSVFGGQANLVQAIGTIFETYDPEIIAVHTTCLSETIGDDVPQIVAKAGDEGKIPPGKRVIHASTPSYVGSHCTGYASMAKAMVDYLAERTGIKNGRLCLIPGWIEPSDMRELKRMVGLFGIEPLMYPDTSGVLDAPLTGKFSMYPEGGARVADIAASGDAKAVIGLGEYCAGPAARLLDSKCKVPCDIVDLPYGLRATDRFVDAVRRAMGIPVPEALSEERGRLVDLMADMQQYGYGKRVAIAGDPDQLVPLAEFLVSLDMEVAYVVTGTPGKAFEKAMEAVLADSGSAGAKVRCPGDLLALHEMIKEEPVDLIIGNTYCKYIARDEDIPFVRHGFPILDRVGHSIFPSVGYMGAMRLLERIYGALMDRQDRDAPNEKLELVM